MCRSQIFTDISVGLARRSNTSKAVGLDEKSWFPRINNVVSIQNPYISFHFCLALMK